MAHFPRIRTSPLWLSGGVLLASEMEAFDDHLSKAVNGDEGGVWSPSSLIEIGGAGVKITGALNVTTNAQLQGGATITGGDLSVSLNASIQGNASVGGTCTVSGATTLNGGCTVTGGNLTVAQSAGVQDDLNVGDALNVGGNTQLGGTCTVTGAATFNAPVTCNSTLTVQLAATFNATTNICNTLVIGTAAATLTKPMIEQGQGRRRVRAVIGSNTDATYSVNDVSEVLVPSGATSTSATYTLDTVGAGDGDKVLFSTRSAPKGVTVTTLGAGGANYSLNLTGPSSFTWLEFTFLSGGWILSRWFQNQ